MRKHKYRAYHHEAELMINENYEGEVFIWKYQGQPLSIMEFTGLYDKDGSEIFEGDILAIQYNHLGNVTTELIDGAYNISKYNLNKCKIIGNIFE